MLRVVSLRPACCGSPESAAAEGQERGLAPLGYQAPSGGWRATKVDVPFIEPRFLMKNNPKKPHNKLKKAQTTLRGKKLNLELKLGGESDNPTTYI